MSYQQNKGMDEKKMLPKAPSFSRITTGSIPRRTISRSKSFSSAASASMIIRSCDVEESGDSAEMEMEKYEEECSHYLSRVLQSRMLREDRTKEGNMKNCLVSLKTQFEELLAENVRLNEQFRKIEIHGIGTIELTKILSQARKMLNALRENDSGLREILANLEGNANKLRLVNFPRRQLEEAFEKNLIGFDSEIYKLLKLIEREIGDRESPVAEIAEILREIRSLHAGNEELKKRCTALADQRRKESIILNYEKYLSQALKECADISNEFHANEIASSFANDSISQKTIDWEDPTSSSTPTVDVHQH